MNQQTAQGLASLGRGPDSMLVHMAPSEVAGLQALAMKHGGTLTINPETGLAEAGFLSKILPMVLGAGLAATGIGAPMAALLVGGGYGIAKGSLKEGLMAGLGAYGGAGLGTSLAAAAPAATEAAAGSVVPSASGLAEMSTASAQAANAGSPTLLNAAQQANTGLGTGFGAAFDPAATSAIYPTPPTQPMYLSQTGLTATPPPPINIGPPPPPSFERMGAGLKDVLSSGDKALAFAGENAMPLGALGIAALDQDPKAASENIPGMIRPYTYSREKVPSAFEDVAGAPLSSKERRYFTDKYTALTPYKAPGPEYKAAEGGPVEAMSDANAIGMNTGYPQADIRTGAYATPFQQPISRDMIPYAGQPQFAGGGSINLQGTFSSGGGQGGGQTGGSNNPQPFIGNNNAPSMGLQTHRVEQGFTPMPGPAGDREGIPSGLQGLLKNMSMFAGGGSVSPGGGPSSDGMLARLFAQANRQSGSSNASIGGYTYDPATGQYSGGTPLAGQPSGAGIPAQYANGSIGGFSFNPATGQYTKLDSAPEFLAYQKAAAAEAAASTDSGGGSGAAAGGLMPLAQGGISSLGDYSDGGRLLRGPGDGVSDDIPATIGQKQQARLADGEFVVPARIVSELGNGSTEAGARQLYSMMDRVQKARKKTVGKDRVATDSRAAKLLPA
jgi:hypothetical protein